IRRAAKKLRATAFFSCRACSMSSRSISVAISWARFAVSVESLVSAVSAASARPFASPRSNARSSAARTSFSCSVSGSIGTSGSAGAADGASREISGAEKSVLNRKRDGFILWPIDLVVIIASVDQLVVALGLGQHDLAFRREIFCDRDHARLRFVDVAQPDRAERLHIVLEQLRCAGGHIGEE